MTFRDRQSDDFRHLVGVVREDQGFQRCVMDLARLDLGMHFGGAFDLALPTVDRLAHGETHASCELLFEKKCANLSRLVLVRKAAQYQKRREGRLHGSSLACPEALGNQDR